MDRLGALSLFAKAVETGSFSEAQRRNGGYVDGTDFVVDPCLFEEDKRLVAVRRGPEKKLDHHIHHSCVGPGTEYRYDLALQ